MQLLTLMLRRNIKPGYRPLGITAELAFILIGMLARQILPSANAMHSGGWQTHLGRDLRGARLGILGLGRLGGELAGFANAFGMEVQAWSQNLTNERCAELNVTYADRETLFRTSDFISIHLKLSNRVKHLVGASELDLMKPDACLVNTRALIPTWKRSPPCRRADRRCAITSIPEPVPENDPLRNTPNLLMTPHIGYVTRETMTVFYRDTLDAIASILSGQPIRQLKVACDFSGFLVNLIGH